MSDRSNDYLSTIKSFLNNIPDSNHRVFKIKYSNAFCSTVHTQHTLLKNKFKVINFASLYESRLSYETNPSQGQKEFWQGIAKNIIGFLPVVGMYFSMVSLLTDFAKYNISQKDICYLKKSFNLSMKPRKKYRKLRNIIIVDSIEQLSCKEMQYLHFLICVTEQKYLTQTAILVVEQTSFFSTITVEPCCICTLDIKEFDTLIHNNKLYKLSNTHKVVLDIIYVERIEAVDMIPSDNAENVVSQIIQEMITHAKVNNNEGIYSFFKLCSFLFDTFSIEDVTEISLLAKLPQEKCLQDALKTNLINKHPCPQMFSFLQEKFREYFQMDTQIFEVNVYQRIYDYLSTHYPTHYSDLALISNVLQSNESVTASSHIIAFYHQSWTMPGYKLQSIEKYMKNNECAQLVLILNYAYIDAPERLTEYTEDAHRLLVLLENSMLNINAKAAALSYAARILYEVEEDKEKLQSIEKLYRSYIAQIVDFKTADCKVFRYLLDYICFATVIEDDSTVTRLVQRYTAYLNKCNVNGIDRMDYIKFSRLGNAIYPTDPLRAIEMTNRAYLIYDNNVVNILAAINYSVSLCLNGEYEKAYDILKKNIVYGNSANSISRNNNIFVANCLGKKGKPANNSQLFYKLIMQMPNTNSSDAVIVKNNYFAACVAENVEISSEATTGLSCVSDKYHRFFNNINLLAKAYFSHDATVFESIRSSLMVPGLLQGYEDYFSKKNAFMWQHFNERWDYEKLDAALQEWSVRYNANQSETFYSHPVVYGLIERWFE